MPITNLTIPYPDFKLHEVIDPEQFDFNNGAIIDKVNAVLAILNQITDAVADGGSGADKISLTPIASFTSTKLQSYLEEVITRLQSTTSGASGAGFIGTPVVSGVTGATVSAQLNSLKSLLDVEKARITTLETRATNVEGRATTLEGRATSLEGRATSVEGRATTLESGKANKSDTYTKSQVDASLALRTPLTGDHKGTWNGLSPGQASEAINGGRLDVLETQVDNALSTPLTLTRGVQTVTSPKDSTVRVVEVAGKTVVNRVPLFDSGLWTFVETTVDSPSKITINSLTIFNVNATTTIPVKEGISYIFKAKTTGSLYIYIRNADTNALILEGGVGNEIAQPFAVPIGCTKVKIVFSTNVIGATTVDSFSINEGTTAKEFVANVKGVTNPTIENTTTGDSLSLKTTLHTGDTVYVDGNGQARVNRAKKEIVLDGSLAWTFANDATGYKEVLFPTPLNSTFNVVPVKYNGKILTNYGSSGALLPSADSVRIAGANFIISIADTDSGWGETYQPTVAEIKAYFLGWKMYQDLQDPNIPYSTGTKAWIYREDNGAWSSKTLTLPTTQAPINSKWQPYRLIYDLATPQDESVQSYGSLKLVEGANQIEVTEGRIVRERIVPYVYTNGFTYVNFTADSINWEALLKHKNNGILELYKDGKPMNISPYVEDMRLLVPDSQSQINKYGNYRIKFPTSLYNPTSLYEVDYIPLEPYKLTAYTNAIDVAYQANLGSVVSTLVDDVTDLEQRQSVSEGLMQSAFDGETVLARKVQEAWITATLQNGWTGTIKYRKNDFGQVLLQFAAMGGTIGTGTIIATLPVGYRAYANKISLYNSTSSVFVGDLVIDSLGSIKIISGSFAQGVTYYAEIIYNAS